MERRHFLQTGITFGAAAALTPSAFGAKESSESSKGSQTKASAEKFSGKNPEIKRPPFKKVRIVQLGVRHNHASAIMAALRRLPDFFEVLGVAAESPEWQKRVKNQDAYKGLSWFDPEKILDLPGLEAVAVETEMVDLVAVSMKCAKRGLPIHVDKPFGEDLNECKKLLDFCKEKNVIIQPGYMFRGNPAVQLGIRAVRSGWLGDIVDIYGTMNRYDVDPKFRKWLSGYRGGGMFIVGSHIADIIVSMLGAPSEIQLVERPVGNDGVSDNALSLLLYLKTIAQIRVSLREVDGNPHRRLIVAGTNGTFELYPIEGTYSSYPTFKRVPLNVRLTLKKGNAEYKAGTHELKIDPSQGRYSDQLIDFAHYIRGTKKNPYTTDYEYLVQKVVLASSGYIPWKAE